jgi:hypothetical protein
MRRNREWLRLCAAHHDDHDNHLDHNDFDLDNPGVPTWARDLRPGSGMLRYRQRAIRLLW